MKYLLLLPILFSHTSICAQVDVNKIDSLIENCKKKVAEIDKLELFKALLDYDGYRTDNKETVSEWLTVLYYDSSGILRKSKMIFSFIGDEGEYHHYYDNGTAIYSTYYAYSAMNNGYSASRYLSDKGELLSIDFLRRDDDRGGQVIEHIQRTGGYDLPIPSINGEEYDKIKEIEDFNVIQKDLYNLDSLYMPDNLIPVRFIIPQKGDETRIVANGGLVYSKMSSSSCYLSVLNVGDKVDILENRDGWHKIRYTDDSKQITGCIKSSFLASIEKTELRMILIKKYYNYLICKMYFLILL